MPEVITYTPTGDELGYTFGGRLPVAHLQPGDTLIVDTEDCFNGLVRTVDDLPSQVCDLTRVNPIAGPFFVDGAEPGDTLAVHLHTIEPTRDWGVSATFPHFGALTSTHTTATLQPPLEERVWIYPIDPVARTVRFHARSTEFAVDLPLEPMLGTIGVAPAGHEVRTTLDCGTHGGNLDTPRIRAGTTVYLPVFVFGAMLSLGDGHARQGHGEACGVAVETAMHTTLTVDLIKGASTPWPRIETDTTIGVIGCARPLEDAYRIAHTDLTGWVAKLTGLDQLDAYQLVAQAGTAPIGNVCDPNYTIVAELDKRYLPAAVAYDGVHHRLRQPDTNGGQR